MLTYSFFKNSTILSELVLKYKLFDKYIKHRDYRTTVFKRYEVHVYLIIYLSSPAPPPLHTKPLHIFGELRF